jgi:hypothetical protein
VALLDHAWVRSGDAVHDAPNVDVDEGVPVVERHPAGVATDGDPRVVEEEVEALVLPEGVAHHLLDGGGIGHVHRHGARGAGTAQGLGRPLRTLEIDVREPHVGPVPNQPLSERPPDSGRSPGDDRKLVSKDVDGHRPLLGMVTVSCLAALPGFPRAGGPPIRRGLPSGGVQALPDESVPLAVGCVLAARVPYTGLTFKTAKRLSFLRWSLSRSGVRPATEHSA